MRIMDRWATRTAGRLGATQVFRPPVGAVVTVLWAVVTVLWLAAAAAAGWRSLLVQLPALVLVATVVHATCTRPLVAVGPACVLLRNVVRDVSIPWEAVTGVDTRYALTLTAGGRRHTAWAAPAPSRFSTTRATREDLESVQWSAADGPIPASATLRSDAGAAAALIRRYRASPAAPAADHADQEPTGVEIRCAMGVVVLLAASAAATVLVAVVT